MVVKWVGSRSMNIGGAASGARGWNPLSGEKVFQNRVPRTEHIVPSVVENRRPPTSSSTRAFMSTAATFLPSIACAIYQTKIKCAVVGSSELRPALGAAGAQG